jgi:NTP pyrophosphatase (non-canonical NTP hydrolase)
MENGIYEVEIQIAVDAAPAKTLARFEDGRWYSLSSYIHHDGLALKSRWVANPKGPLVLRAAPDPVTTAVALHPPLRLHGYDTYIREALRTESPITPSLVERLTGAARVVHATWGLMTEIGELVDPFKRAVFYGKAPDKRNLAEEVGDILWYLAILLDWAGLDFYECMMANINKLRVRYPQKFDAVAAIERNTEAEMAALDAHLNTETPHVPKPPQ